MVDELVSIIMPSYNTGKYIDKTINSVLKQSYKKWELIIIDDNSDDNTDEVVKKYLSDSRIIYEKNNVNRGAAYSRNKAIKKACGEWIAFLDSDDLWDSNKLEVQIEYMKKNHYSFTGTASRNISENGKDLNIINTSPKHVSEKKMILYCWPSCLTVMYHVPEVGEIQINNLKKNNDYAMWLKVIKKTDFYYLDKILASYRVRNDSISHDKLYKLIYSHYLLWRVGENKNVFFSVLLTCINMMFGFYKKMKYVKRR